MLPSTAEPYVGKKLKPVEPFPLYMVDNKERCTNNEITNSRTRRAISFRTPSVNLFNPQPVCGTVFDVRQNDSG